MQHVAVLLTPGSVVNLDHDGFHTTVFLIITEVKAHGIEAVAEIPEMGQQTDGTAGTLAGLFFHQVPRGVFQGNEGIPEMVPSPEVGEIDFPA
jgi:hypothetical protein